MNQDASCTAVLEMLRETESDFLGLLSGFHERVLNTAPFEGSWTAAQVADHIVRSNRSVMQALCLDGSPATRRPDERAAELAAVFLDHSVKFQAPSFIIPANGPFDKLQLEQQVRMSVDGLVRTAGEMQPAVSVQHPAFGEITRLELLYFVVYHMQRHAEQLRRISSAAGRSPYSFFSFLFQSPILVF